jgi:hypothetical protein
MEYQMTAMYQSLMGKNVCAVDNGKKKVRWFKSKGAQFYGQIVAVWQAPYRVMPVAYTGTKSDEARECVSPQIWAAVLEDKEGRIIEGPVTDFMFLD